MKLMSIVVPTYNRKEKLRETINAVAKQDYPDYELIIIDDGSSDGTEELVKELQQKFPLRYFKQNNKGPAVARNLGVEKARGEIIVFTDDDCVPEKNWLTELKKGFRNKNIAVVGGSSPFEESKRLIDRWQISQAKNHGERYQSNNLAIKKDIFLKMGGFNTSFDYQGAEDTELLLRLRTKGYRFCRNKKAVILHKHRNNFKSLLKKPWLYGHGDIIYMRDNPKYKTKRPFYIFLSPLVALKTALNQIRHSKKIHFPVFALFNFMSYLSMYVGRFRQAKKINKLNLLLYVPDHRVVVSEGGLKNILIFLTNQCNAGCEHCFYHSKLNKKTEEISTDELKKLFKTVKTGSVTLTGGEPFLRNDLPEICEILEDSGVGRISIATNGYLSDKIYRDLKDILPKSDAKITLNLSLDGLEKTHDKIRNLNGCFKKVIETAKKTKPLMDQYPNFNIVLRTVVTKTNYKELEELADYIDKEVGIMHDFEIVRAPSLSGVPYHLSESADPKDKTVLVSDKDIKEIYKVLKKIIKKRSKKSILDKLRQATQLGMMYYNVEILKKRKHFFHCMAGEDVCTIYPNGDLTLCELMKPVGNLREHNFDFYKVWDNEKAMQQRKHVKNCFCTHGSFVGEDMLKKSRKPLIRLKNFIKLI